LNRLTKSAEDIDNDILAIQNSMLELSEMGNKEFTREDIIEQIVKIVVKRREHRGELQGRKLVAVPIDKPVPMFDFKFKYERTLNDVANKYRHLM
jgi:hypothetical protein